MIKKKYMIKKKKNPIYVWWVGGRSCGAREPVPLGQFEVTPFKLISPLTPTLLRGTLNWAAFWAAAYVILMSVWSRRSYSMISLLKQSSKRLVSPNICRPQCSSSLPIGNISLARAGTAHLLYPTRSPTFKSARCPSGGTLLSGASGWVGWGREDRSPSSASGIGHTHSNPKTRKRPVAPTSIQPRKNNSHKKGIGIGYKNLERGEW